MSSNVRIDDDSYVVKFLEDDSSLVCQVKLHELLEHIFPDEPCKIVTVIVTKEYKNFSDEFPF